MSVHFFGDVACFDETQFYIALRQLGIGVSRDSVNEVRPGHRSAYCERRQNVVNIPTDPSQTVSIQRIQIPNPFFEGDTNVYLLDTEPLTLIDTGIGTEEAFESLSAGFQTAGHRIESLERLILTHKHQDHFGLSRRLQDLTGCEVFIHEDDLRDVTHVSERLDEYVGIIRERLTGWGVPTADIEHVSDMPYRLDRLCGSTAAQSLSDGQRLKCGETEMEVIHTPGHTVGSICLRLENHLFTGDHVLPGYTPNIGGADIEYNGLLGMYLKSLERIAGFDRPGLTVLPGHHEPVTDLTGHVQKTIAHHAQRESQILELLSGGTALSVYEIAIKMFGTMHDFHLVLGTGEVHTHLELLLDKKQVVHEAGRYCLS